MAVVVGKTLGNLGLLRCECEDQIHKYVKNQNKTARSKLEIKWELK